MQVTPHPGHAPVISPDGKWIGFHMWDEGAKKLRQAVMPFEGGEPVKIFDHPGDPTWSRDGKGPIYQERQGGVGNLWGTLVGAFTLGIANKFLEPYAGAVLGKIAILVLIILFIQKRPRGLFALKGRAVEA